ncbi:hypothetical protein IFM89_008995 [Coptis chinensis]|uniref:DBP10 C-terminal domain-containing protein n=1 Tax=Coptis chinensis TaxID=261450 RepID=A0A835HSP9_9MAGN|nr:hypothetical protein IFM89_008995 [Coptis chinensis]
MIDVDDEKEDVEGNLVMAASLINPQAMLFMVKHGSGIVYVGMKEEDLERLDLPLMSSPFSKATTGLGKAAMFALCCEGFYVVLVGRSEDLLSQTKPLPSKESARRAKALPCEGLHPLFKNRELTALVFSERLKDFRPKQTILEAEGEATRQFFYFMVSNYQRNLDKRTEPDAREEDEIVNTVSEEKRKKGRGYKRKAESFKDEEFYISSVPTNQHLEAGLSVRGWMLLFLDLVADDSTGFAKAEIDYHWDKKCKRYIKLNDNDRVTASGKWKMKVFRSRAESGSKIKSTKTGIYKWWKERSHHKVSLRGTNFDGGHSEVDRGFSGDRQMRGDNRNYRRGRSEGDKGFSGNRQMRGDNRNYRGGVQKGTEAFQLLETVKCELITKITKGGKKHGIPNAHVPSEIRNPDQVRKRRQQQTSKISYMKSKPGKGKKFGKNGKKGKK